MERISCWSCIQNMRLVFQTLCTLRASFPAVWNTTLLKTNITDALAFDFSRGLDTEIRDVSAIVNALQVIFPHYIHTLQATQCSRVNTNRIKWQWWKKYILQCGEYGYRKGIPIGLINRKRAKLKCTGLELSRQKKMSSIFNVKVSTFFQPQRQKESNKATIFISRWWKSCE